MLFSSITFLYVFLPCVLIFYFAVPKKFKNSVLLISGLLFYAWGEPKYVFLMIGAILFNYICGIIIENNREKVFAKITLTSSIIVNLGMLAYFKYTDFFIDSFNLLFNIELPLLKIALPIGISFYTFQILSYVIDVYRGTVKAQKNIINLGAYIVMFPQLVAGPIVRYSDINRSLSSRTHSLDKAAAGIRRLIIGLSKKVLIANQLGEFCEQFNAANEKSVLFYWLYAIAFSLQIYYDFSGYSDMAIGLGKIFGFDFIENFDYPFISRSVTEFWRRWHRSLGQWFRDYLYIPLGGNRTTKWKHKRNILIVWLMTGFWHGASWNFIIWGLYFGVLLIIEKLWLYKKLERSKIISRVYLLLIVSLSFVIFSTENLSEILSFFGAMFGIGQSSIISEECFYYLKSFLGLFVIAAIGSTPIVKNISIKITENKFLAFLEPLVLTVLFIVCTAYLIDSSFNPFLYFRF